MSGAVLNVGASNSAFSKAMADMTRDMKLVKSEFSVTAQQAKLFGSETDVLQTKQGELTAKMRIQNDMLELQGNKTNTLVQALDRQKASQTEISNKIEDTNRRYRESVTATGSASTESRKLKEDLDKLKESYARNETSIASQNRQIDNSRIRYNNLQRELLQTRSDLETNTRALEDNGRALEDTGSASTTLGNNVGGIGSRFADFRERIAGGSTSLGTLTESIGTSSASMGPYGVAIGVAVVAIGALGVAVGKFVSWVDEVGSASQKLADKTGATKEEMVGFNDVLNQVYTDNYGEGYSDIADNIALIHQNLGVTGDDLKDITESAYQFNTTFGTDITESTRASKTLMDNFGLSAKDAFNLMTQGQQNGLDFSGEFIDSINEYSVQFGKVGFSATDMFNILKSGADNGAINLDKIGDSVKELSIRVIDGSTTTQDGFTKIGLNADEMGKKFGAGGDSAKEAFYQVIDGLKNIDDPIEQSIAGVDLFGTQWEDVGTDVITNLGSIKDGFDTTKDSMGTLKDNATVGWEGIKRQLVGAFAPIAEELNPVFKEMSKIIAAELQPKIKEFTTWIKDNMPLIKEKAGEALRALIIGFQGVVTSVQLLIKNKDKVKIFTDNLLLMVNPLLYFILKITELKQKATEFSAWLETAFTNLKTTIGEFTTSLPTKISEAFGAIKTGAELKWNEFKLWLGTAVSTLLTNLHTWVSQLPYKAGLLVGTILQTFKTWGINVKTFFTDTIPAIVNDITTWFGQLPAKVKAKFDEVVTNIKQWGIDIKAFFTETIPALVTDITTWFGTLPEKVKAKFNEIVTNIKTWGTDMVTEGKKGADDTVTNIIDGFAGMYDKMLDIGKNIVAGLKKGFKDAWSDLTSWVGTLCDDFTAGVKAKFDQHSPSKVFAQIGKFNAEGLGNGFSDEMTIVNSNVSKTLDGTIKVATDSLDVNKVYNSTKKQADDSNYNQATTLYTTNITQLDGKEISKTTTKEVLSSLNKSTKSNNVSKGKGSLSYV